MAGAIRLVYKYHAACCAKLELGGPGEWEQTFQELQNEDVRSYASGVKKKSMGHCGIWEDKNKLPAETPAVLLESDEESLSNIEMGKDGVLQTAQQILKACRKGTGETRKKLSWIWQTGYMNFEDRDEADDIL